MKTAALKALQAFVLMTLLAAASVTFTTTAYASDGTDSPWQASVQDVMNLVYCMVGIQSCEGLEPGAWREVP